MTAWRVLPTARGPAADLVARVEPTLAAVARDGVAAAGWALATRPALVAGRSAGPDPVDAAALAREDVDLVRRPSGGGPVLWDAGLLALDVWLPRGHPLAPDDVVASYRWLGEALAAALRDLGVTARAIGVDEARAGHPGDGAADRAAAAACYGGLSPWEVVADTPGGPRKAVGLAQLRRRAGTVLQAGVLMTFDAERLAGLLPAPAPRADVAAALARRAAGLDRLLPDTPSPEAVMAAVDRRVADAARAGGGPAA